MSNPQEGNPFGLEEKQPIQPKRKAGRPQGARNKSYGVKMMLEKFEAVYKRIEDTLSEDQRKYYRDAFSGKTEFDPVKESELFMRLLSLYATTLITDGLNERRASKDIADTIAQFRMGLKDLEDMKRKREETKVKSGDDGRVVDPTRESALGRFENIHR